ncbi:unnamed protein product [Cyclocybe aegerita]|uniref:SH3 domain-containing protein n=1 Tax=Cyclocybe aegerita TaxID=1973307 RepID=A0A8S0WY72_CYCAE|nr:unnamed protein product [Cyclocybe aegerita]
MNSLSNTNLSSEGSVPPSPFFMSPTTPTPGSLQRPPSTPPTTATLEPPRSPMPYQSTSSTATPTRATTALPDQNDPQPPELSKITIPDTLQGSASDVPPSPAFSSTSSRRVSSSISPDLMSNRPAPPSPAMSRRVSGAPSTASTRSRTSRPPSAAVSRANSLRKSTASMSARGSPVINPHRVSIGSQLSQSFAPLPSPQNLTFSLTGPQPSTSSSVSASSPSSSTAPSNMGLAASSAGSGAATSTPATPATAVAIAQKHASAVVLVKIRDFGFPATDERHTGLGPDVPKPNRVGRMNRRLGGRTLSTSSIESSDGDGDGEEEEDDGWDSLGGGSGWDGFRMGLGRLSWNSGAGGSGMDAAAALDAASGEGAFPSRMDLDRNFLDGEGEEEEEGEEYYDAGEEEETLYPGLYRAVYAFEPEGTAEMRLVEDQIVRVVGRGGGVGWAVVVDERETEEAANANGFSAPKHALVPESYLEPYKLDWELEEQSTADDARSSGA